MSTLKRSSEFRWSTETANTQKSEHAIELARSFERGIGLNQPNWFFSTLSRILRFLAPGHRNRGSHRFQSRRPNRRIPLTALVELLEGRQLLSAGPQTFYVDPINGSMNGDGSLAHPWHTLQEVISSHLINGVDPTQGAVHAGDTIDLMNGNEGSVTLNQYIGNFNNTGYITVQAYPGAHPSLTYLNVSNSSNWQFRGLTISDPPGPVGLYTMLAEFSACQNIVFDHNTIYSQADVSQWTPQDWLNSGAYRAIYFDGTGATITNNTISNVRYGILVQGTNINLVGNTIDDYADDAIDFTSSNTLIQHNTITNHYGQLTDDNHNDGMQGWTVGGVTNANVTIDSNFVMASTGTDANIPALFSGSATDTGANFDSLVSGISIFDGLWTNVTVTNNVVGADLYHGISMYGLSNSLIANNTVIKDDSNPTMPTWLLVAASKTGVPATNDIVRNNIASMFNLDPGVVNDHNISLTSNNLWSQSTSDTIVVDPTVLFNTYDPVDGLFDLRLAAGSPAIGTGNSLNALATDITGVPRNPASIDIGAYAYVPLVQSIPHFMTVSGLPSSPVTAGAALSSPLVLTIDDQFGNVATNYVQPVTLTISEGRRFSTGSSTISVMPVAGIATFSGLAFNQAGTYSLTASVAQGPLLNSGSGANYYTATVGNVTVTPGSTTAMTVTQYPPTSVTAGQSFISQISLYDQYGNLATSDTSTVTMKVTCYINSAGSVGTGLFSNGSNTVSVQVAGGIARFNNFAFNQTGTYWLTAYDSEGSLLKGSATVGNIAVTPATPTITVSDASGTYTGSPFAATATVTGLSGVPSNSLDGVALILNYYSGSTATGTPLAGAPTAAGTYTVVASFAGSTNYKPITHSATFTIQPQIPTINAQPISATTMAVTQSPSGSVTAGQAFVAQVSLYDQHGNIATGDTSTVTMKITYFINAAGTTGTGLFSNGSNNVSVQVVGGIARFINLAFNQSGTYWLTVYDLEASLLTGSASVGNISVFPAAAARLAFANPLPSTLAAGGSTGPLIVLVEDQFGNLITNDNSTTLTLTINGVVVTANQDVKGIYNFGSQILNTKGSNSVTVTSPGLTQVSAVITVN